MWRFAVITLNPPRFPFVFGSGYAGLGVSLRFLRASAVLSAVSLSATHAEAENPPVENANKSPRFVLNYPAVEGFCPPVRAYFEDVAQSIQQVRGRTSSHQLNGGYGLAVRAKVAGKNLLHLGADVAWHRAGDPVFAIANGVVRTSEGPAKDAKRQGANTDDSDIADAEAPTTSRSLQWGNLITIEHRSPDGNYITSIYGHFSHERRVSVGDVVKAGQIIGAVGKPGVENGGYKAHLHFAILDGRAAEPGTQLFKAPLAGENVPVTLVSLDEKEIEIKAEMELPSNAEITINGHSYKMTARDGKHWLPADVLHYLQRPDFRIVGYDLSTKGWRDPTAFLRELGADTNPARFEVALPSQKNKVARRGAGPPTARVPKSKPSALPPAKAAPATKPPKS